MYQISNSGLRPLKKDRRDLSHTKVFGAASISGLPASGLGRKPISIKNQQGTFFCTAYGTSAASEYQEGVELSEEFQVAKIGQMAGYPILHGVDPRPALRAAIAFGSLPKKHAPLSLSNDGAEKIADWANWPSYLDKEALEHAKESYFKVDGPYDVFDNIRSALFKGKDENQVVVVFGPFYDSWVTKSIIDKNIGIPSLHCYLFIDWKQIDGVDYLVIQNSYGKEYGDGGLQYITREAVNDAFKNVFEDGSGLFIFRDINKNDAISLQRQQMNLLEILLDVWYRTLAKITT